MGSEGSTSPFGGGCAVCGGAAAVYCVADAAALCVPCDAAIHAANPLASLHERVRLSVAAVAAANSGVYDLFAADDDGCGSAASSCPAPGQGQCSPNYSSSSFTASESGGERSLFDLLSDVDIMASCGGGGFGLGNMPADGVAPHSAPPLCLQPGLAASAAGALTSWSPQTTAALAAAAEREARVRRYREKRKNRRFQKTIRYASRKAYAEARPRINGRFVKRAASASSSSASDYDGTAVAATSACQATDGGEAAKFWLSFSDESRGDGVGFYMGDAAAYGVVPTL